MDVQNAIVGKGILGEEEDGDSRRRQRGGFATFGARISAVVPWARPQWINLLFPQLATFNAKIENR